MECGGVVVRSVFVECQINVKCGSDFNVIKFVSCWLWGCGVLLLGVWGVVECLAN